MSDELARLRRYNAAAMAEIQVLRAKLIEAQRAAVDPPDHLIAREALGLSIEVNHEHFGPTVTLGEALEQLFMFTWNDGQEFSARAFTKGLCDWADKARRREMSP